MSGSPNPNLENIPRPKRGSVSVSSSTGNCTKKSCSKTGIYKIGEVEVCRSHLRQVLDEALRPKAEVNERCSLCSDGANTVYHPRGKHTKTLPEVDEKERHVWLEIVSDELRKLAELARDDAGYTGEHDSAFIAAFNPRMALDLLDERDHQTERRVAWTKRAPGTVAAAASARIV